MKKQTLRAYIVVWTTTFAFAYSPIVLAQDTTTDSKQTSIKPDVNFRQAYLVPRHDAAFYRSTYKNHTNQLYLSLKLVQTTKFVNEVVVEPAIRTQKDAPNEIETVIDQGYIRAIKKGWHLTAGKKNEVLGSGFFVNPSDLLNEGREVFDPYYQREGKMFTRFGWSKGLWNFGLGYIAPYEQDANFGKAWVQIQADLWETETVLQYTYNKFDLSTVGLSAARFFGDHVELHVDSRYQQRARDKSDQAERIVFDCPTFAAIPQAIRNERSLECAEPEGDIKTGGAYSLFGTRLVFTPKRTIVAELIQNQTGLNKDELAMYYRYVTYLRDRSSSSTEEPGRILAKQYVFLGYQDEDSIAATSINLSGLYNLNDQSSFANLELRHTLNGQMSVTLAQVLRAGVNESEFGESAFSQTTYLSFRGAF